MNNKDWKAKALLQRDLSFIEYIQNQSHDGNTEDDIISALDGEDITVRETANLKKMIKMSRQVFFQLPKESQVILTAYLREGNYEKLSHYLKTSISTAWKKVQKIKNEIEEIKCQMKLK